MNDEEIIVVIGEEEEQEGVVVEGDVLKGKNGTDGYTPVKGVDYFDGVDGYTPVKGTDYFTETEIQQIKQDILNDVSSFDLLVVDSLPTENIQEKTIYLAPNTETTENNVYDEYIYVNSTWEIIGSTAVDLSNYYNKEEVDNKVANIQALPVGGTTGQVLTKNSDIDGDVSWQDSGDTLPIGSIVDYEGDTVPEGYVEVDDNMSEIAVGYAEPTNGAKVWFQNGKNLYDKNTNPFESGDLNNSNGSSETNSSRVRTVGFIEVKPNMSYTLSNVDGINAGRLIQYNSNKEFISAMYNQKTFTTTSNTRYIRWSYNQTTTPTNIQLEVGDKATEYEDYVGRKIFVLNSNNEYERFV